MRMLNSMTVRQAILTSFLLLAGPAVASSSEAVILVGPAEATGSGLAPSCPTFHWVATPGAKRYELVVYRLDTEGEPVLAETIPGAGASWTPGFDRCLDRGSSYAWSLRSVGDSGFSEWSEPGLFRVSEAPSAGEVDEALAVIERYLEQVRESDPEGAMSPLGSSESPAATALDPLTTGVAFYEGAILIHGNPVVALPLP